MALSKPLVTSTVVIAVVMPAWVLGAYLAVDYWEHGHTSMTQSDVPALTGVFQAFGAVAGTLWLLISLNFVDWLVGYDMALVTTIFVVLTAQCWCCATFSIGLWQGTTDWVMWWLPGSVAFWVALTHMIMRESRAAKISRDAANDQANARLNVWMQNNPGDETLLPNNVIIRAEDEDEDEVEVVDSNRVNDFIEAYALFR